MGCWNNLLNLQILIQLVRWDEMKKLLNALWCLYVGVSCTDKNNQYPEFNHRTLYVSNLNSTCTFAFCLCCTTCARLSLMYRLLWSKIFKIYNYNLYDTMPFKSLGTLRRFWEGCCSNFNGFKMFFRSFPFA